MKTHRAKIDSLGVVDAPPLLDLETKSHSFPDFICVFISKFDLLEKQFLVTLQHEANLLKCYIPGLELRLNCPLIAYEFILNLMRFTSFLFVVDLDLSENKPGFLKR
uniref:Uncharacterized protein n=1 Tax=Lactuca sativa TaxID=4236 RepID=A0A9R1VUG7_LACSA|nr:hypothetical protein LSAT_V11C400167810 [Lactuca sativa]